MHKPQLSISLSNPSAGWIGTVGKSPQKLATLLLCAGGASSLFTPRNPKRTNMNSELGYFFTAPMVAPGMPITGSDKAPHRYRSSTWFVIFYFHYFSLVSPKAADSPNEPVRFGYGTLAASKSFPISYTINPPDRPTLRYLDVRSFATCGLAVRDAKTRNLCLARGLGWRDHHK